MSSSSRPIKLRSASQIATFLLMCLSIAFLSLSGQFAHAGAAKLDGPILVLGDSLSAGYGIDPEKGWVQLLQERLQQTQHQVEVVNASISGETAAGGTHRLTALLEQYQPSIVILELGGNDGLRGYPISQMRQQLNQAITLSRNSGAEVLLLGMQIPPNYGPRYSRLFAESYPALAKTTSTITVPFFLDGVATKPEWMQADGIHPTAEGQPQMLENVWPSLTKLMRQMQELQ